MLELPVVTEARRELDICNACRYCEGLCAVFPALERRSVFNTGDMVYLANLCHDCRACFEACPYAPPHELAVDIPHLMSEIREQTYATYAWPRTIAARVDRSLRAGLLLVATAVVVVLAAVLIGQGLDELFRSYSGPGSFYEVVPWLAMLLPFAALALLAIGVLTVAGIRFWRDTGLSLPTDMTRPQGIASFLRATWDVVIMRYLGGGGPGCTYPGERPNQRRRLYHQLILYGFASAFLATVVAAVYQDLLGILPPYDVVSVPVLLGLAGGASMLAGCIGLLEQKPKATAQRMVGQMRTMDATFIVVLVLVNLSGVAVLALRETSVMGVSLAVHLGLTGALFLALPYGKFAHAVYRYLALVRNRLESTKEESQ